MADDTTETDDKVTDDTETDDKDSTGDGEEWTPPTREEFEALQKSIAEQAAALKRANAESAERRRKLADLERKHEDDETKAKREASEAAIASLKPVAVRSAAKAAFLEAGANAGRVDKLFRMLDLNKVDVDGDTVTGLDEQIADIKADVPELFAPAKDDKRPPRVDSAPRKPPPLQPKTIGELVVAQLEGKA